MLYKTNWSNYSLTQTYIMCREANQKLIPHLHTNVPVVTMHTIKMYAMQNQVSILNSSSGDDTTGYELCRMESQLFPDHLKWEINRDFFPPIWWVILLRVTRRSD